MVKPLWKDLTESNEVQNEFSIRYYPNIDAWSDALNRTWWQLRSNKSFEVKEFYDYECELPTGRIGILLSDESKVLVS